MFSSPNRIFPPIAISVDDAVAGLDHTRLMVVAAATAAVAVVNCWTNVRLEESYCGLLPLLLLLL